MTPTESRKTDAPHAVRTASRLARRLARRTAAVIAECNYAQRRVLALRLAPDSYVSDPAAAPHTYEDFLFRTSGPLLREPSAGARAAGRPVAG